MYHTAPALAYTSADNGFDLPVFDLIFSRDYEMTMRKEWTEDSEWMDEFQSWISHPSENTNHLVQVLKVYVMKNGRTDQSVSDDQTIFSKAITLIDIGFESLEVRLTKEKIADRASSLISDLGGQLGLWLGVSMVSMLEVISCLVYYIPKQMNAKRIQAKRALKKSWAESWPKSKTASSLVGIAFAGMGDQCESQDIIAKPHMYVRPKETKEDKKRKIVVKKKKQFSEDFSSDDDEWRHDGDDGTGGVNHQYYKNKAFDQSPKNVGFSDFNDARTQNVTHTNESFISARIDQIDLKTVSFQQISFNAPLANLSNVAEIGSPMTPTTKPKPPPNRRKRVVWFDEKDTSFIAHPNGNFDV